MPPSLTPVMHTAMLQVAGSTAMFRPAQGAERYWYRQQCTKPTHQAHQRAASDSPKSALANDIVSCEHAATKFSQAWQSADPSRPSAGPRRIARACTWNCRRLYSSHQVYLSLRSSSDCHAWSCNIKYALKFRLAWSTCSVHMQARDSRSGRSHCSSLARPQSCCQERHWRSSRAFNLLHILIFARRTVWIACRQKSAVHSCAYLLTEGTDGNRKAIWMI